MSVEIENWWIKVVPRATPNADGHWINCGKKFLPQGQRSWKVVTEALGSFCPLGHEIVALSSKDPETRS